MSIGNGWRAWKYHDLKASQVAIVVALPSNNNKKGIAIPLIRRHLPGPGTFLLSSAYVHVRVHFVPLRADTSIHAPMHAWASDECGVRARARAGGVAWMYAA